MAMGKPVSNLVIISGCVIANNFVGLYKTTVKRDLHHSVFDKIIDLYSHDRVCILVESYVIKPLQILIFHLQLKYN